MRCCVPMKNGQEQNKGATHCYRPRCSRAQPAKRPTSHANFDPVLLLDAVSSRSEALERRLRTSPKRPTRAKE